MLNLSKYDLWLFDCDGVILQSNKIKSEAMYQVALHFSQKILGDTEDTCLAENIAIKYQQHHMENAGVTRFLKFRYLFETLLEQTEYEHEYQQTLTLFGHLCVEKLIQCSPTKGVEDFLTSIDKTQHKYIISAGTESELNHVFSKNNLAQYFQAIYGGPRTKSEIFADVLARYPNAKPLYFGDALADHIVAQEYDVDFVFVSDYTEFKGWQEYFAQYPKVEIIQDFAHFTL